MAQIFSRYLKELAAIKPEDVQNYNYSTTNAHMCFINQLTPEERAPHEHIIALISAR